MKIRLLVPLLLLVFSACKKTKLEGDLSVLIGKWQWRYTVLADNLCSSIPDTVITHSPSIDGYDYEMTFLKKGKLEIAQTGQNRKKYRLIQDNFSHDPNEVAFLFYLNKKGKNGFYVSYYVRNGKEFFSSNTLPLPVLDGFDGCRVEYSVFEKVE